MAIGAMSALGPFSRIFVALNFTNMVRSQHCYWFRTLTTILIGVFVLVGAGAHDAHADNRDVPGFPSDWQSDRLKDHPLVGKVWSRANGGFITVQDYGMALAKSRFVLLGEVHDNPDHHRLQAWAIHASSKLRGARIVEGAAQLDVVAMEMLNPEQQKAIDKFYGRDARVPRQRTAADFGRLVKWDKSGWPDYKIYEPIIDEAIRARLVLSPANPTRAESRQVAKKDFVAVVTKDVERLALDKPLPKAAAADLAAQIRDSHCGMLPDAAIPGMVRVQRLRDARMADAMLVSSWKGAVLIAGNGHVRQDRGVPWYLAKRGIAPTEVSVVRHVEVSENKTELADYGLGTSSDAGSNKAASEAIDRSDFVVFTPRQSRPEACKEMRRQMEAIKARKSSQTGAEEPADAAKDKVKR